MDAEIAEKDSPRSGWSLRYEAMIAVRFLRQARAQTMLVFGGAAVGVGVIVFLTALLGGLQASLIEKTLGSQAHIVVKPPELITRRVYVRSSGETVAATVDRPAQRLRPLEEWTKVLRALEAVPGVTAASPVLNGPGFVARGGAEKSVSIFGVEPERFDVIVPIGKRLIAGHFRLSSAEILIGSLLAKDLGVEVGDSLRVYSTTGDAGEVLTIAGIFELGNQAVNTRWALIPLRRAQSLLGLPGGITQIDLRVDKIFDAQNIAERVEDQTGLVADSWMKTNADLLVGLKGQDSSGQMISFFVIVAVALGIASVLIVSVVQRSKEIGILRATGTTARSIARIFLIQGGITGLFASIFGCLLGAGLAKFFETLSRNPDGSPIFPVNLETPLFAGASLVAILVGLLASWGPARRAARLDPATVIRHD
ncbi:MAG: ABC transporter permease [Myxococcota bacterium]